MVEAIELLKLADSFCRFATKNEDRKNNKVVNLKEYRESKTPKKNDLVWLFEQMDPTRLFSGNTINLDDMHQARKAAGFPKVPEDAPSWVHIIVGILDKPDPVERDGLMKMYLSMGRFSKDPEQKQQAEQQYQQFVGEEKKEFLAAAKRGWLRASQYNQWKKQYSLLLSARDEETLFHYAKEYINEKEEREFEKRKKANKVPKTTNIPAMPIGTTLYIDEWGANHMWGIKKITKIKPETWAADINPAVAKPGAWSIDDENVVLDPFVERVKDFGRLLFQPEASIQYRQPNPSKEELEAVMDHFLKNDPEKFLDPWAWKFEIPGV